MSIKNHKMASTKFSLDFFKTYDISNESLKCLLSHFIVVCCGKLRKLGTFDQNRSKRVAKTQAEVTNPSRGSDVM